jgi:hypothetical protein
MKKCGNYYLPKSHPRYKRKSSNQGVIEHVSLRVLERMRLHRHISLIGILMKPETLPKRDLIFSLAFPSSSIDTSFHRTVVKQLFQGTKSTIERGIRHTRQSLVSLFVYSERKVKQVFYSSPKHVPGYRAIHHDRS